MRTWANAVFNAKEVQRVCFDIYNISRGSIESNFISKIETNLNIYLTVLTRFVNKKITFINEA